MPVGSMFLHWDDINKKCQPGSFPDGPHKGVSAQGKVGGEKRGRGKIWWKEDGVEGGLGLGGRFGGRGCCLILKLILPLLQDFSTTSGPTQYSCSHYGTLPGQYRFGLPVMKKIQNINKYIASYFHSSTTNLGFPPFPPPPYSIFIGL